MKKTMFFSCLAVLLVVSSAFLPREKANIPEFMANDFQYTLDNADLADRFEVQFPDIVAKVSQVDVHLTANGDYYYTVYGSNESGEAVVDFFKTTEQEVNTESYNYIEMTERTMAWPPRKKCREATTFPPPGNFCDVYNTGWVCGIQSYPGGPCFLY